MGFREGERDAEKAISGSRICFASDNRRTGSGLDNLQPCRPMALIHRDGYPIPALASSYDSLVAASSEITLLPSVESFEVFDFLSSLVFSCLSAAELSCELLDETEYASQGFEVTDTGRKQAQALAQCIIGLREDLRINAHAALKAFLIVCPTSVLPFSLV